MPAPAARRAAVLLAVLLAAVCAPPALAQTATSPPVAEQPIIPGRSTVPAPPSVVPGETPAESPAGVTPAPFPAEFPVPRAQPSIERPAQGPGEAPPPVWLVLPFVLLLLMIATGPLFYPHFWHHHYPKVAVGLGLLVAAYYFGFVDHGGEYVLHGVTEYISFIALLASLYIASGGILIETDVAGTPRTNTALLFFGALLSNVIGTTGASMLLIRPFMRINKGRIQPYHVVFFIFAISNIGGALTPIGDPPLFLGFLRGVPFFWTVTHIWYIWLPTIALVLGVFYVLDTRNKGVSVREAVPAESLPETTPALAAGLSPAIPKPGPVKITGAKNFAWLALIIGAVFIDPNVIPAVPDLHAMHIPFGIREVIMLAICGLAYVTANKAALKGNDFNFEPIKEVGFLFIGIFLTMIPALKLIELLAQDNAAVLGPTAFFWGTGILSSFLDNAPTYLSFLSAAMGKFAIDPLVIAKVQSGALAGEFTVNNPAAVQTMAVPGLGHPESWHFVQAISVAAVFFGAMTYIGNGPNFMVKAIAESSGVKCPSFFGYFLRYAIPVLLPIYFLVWLVFFSGYVLQLT